jgi:hypothetical protein
VPKRTNRSDGANLACLVALVVALDAPANLRHLKPRAADGDAPLLAAASAVEHAQQAGASFSVSDFFQDLWRCAEAIDACVRVKMRGGLRKIEGAARSTRNSPIANCNTQLPMNHHALLH